MFVSFLTDYNIYDLFSDIWYCRKTKYIIHRIGRFSAYYEELWKPVDYCSEHG